MSSISRRPAPSIFAARRGRPARDGFITIRVAREEHEALARAACRRGEPLSDLVRRALRRELAVMDGEAT